MIVLELINDALVIKIKKTSKKALLFGALGLIILLILFFSFQSLLPQIVDQALVSLDFSYSPDIYVSGIYNENVTYSFMIYKSAYPKLKEYLTQSRLNYEELNNS